jgi:pimeloyl-ACP methyl ester carboxylesterase
MRLSLITGLLALSTGCMSLDFLVFSAPRVDEYVPDPEYVDVEDIELVTFDTPDGLTLHGVWYRTGEAAQPPLIYFHGNSTTLNNLWSRLAYYSTWGYDVFAFDYRGFGMSDGSATFEGVFETDGEVAVAYVSETTGVAPEEIPWVTISMGSGVAAHTNDEVAAQAVILHAMFPSTDALADDGTGNDLPMGWFFDDEYDNLAATAAMTSPVFVIHGLEDDYIDGPAYGPQVFEAAPEPKQLWQPEDVAHSDLFEVLPDEFRQRSRDWFEQFGSVPPLP